MDGDLKLSPAVLSWELTGDKFIKSSFFLSLLNCTLFTPLPCVSLLECVECVCVSAERQFMVTLGPPQLNQYLVMHEGEACKYN